MADPDSICIGAAKAGTTWLQPFSFMKNICEYLNVEYKRQYFDEIIHQKVNSSPDLDMPREIERLITDFYHQGIQRLSDRLGSHAKFWLDKCEAVLADKTI